jgi:hypothetical protein
LANRQRSIVAILNVSPFSKRAPDNPFGNGSVVPGWTLD